MLYYANEGVARRFRMHLALGKVSRYLPYLACSALTSLGSMLYGCQLVMDVAAVHECPHIR